jgi:hypothetical protein
MDRWHTRLFSSGHSRTETGFEDISVKSDCLVKALYGGVFAIKEFE